MSRARRNALVCLFWFFAIASLIWYQVDASHSVRVCLIVGWGYLMMFCLSDGPSFDDIEALQTKIEDMAEEIHGLREKLSDLEDELALVSTLNDIEVD